MMEPPVFKVGDRVRYKPTGALGTIVLGPKTSRGKNYTIEFDCGYVFHGGRFGPQGISLEFLEPANESPATITSK